MVLVSSKNLWLQLWNTARGKIFKSQHLNVTITSSSSISFSWDAVVIFWEMLWPWNVIIQSKTYLGILNLMQHKLNGRIRFWKNYDFFPHKLLKKRNWENGIEGGKKFWSGLWNSINWSYCQKKLTGKKNIMAGCQCDVKHDYVYHCKKLALFSLNSWTSLSFTSSSVQHDLHFVNYGLN